MMAAFKRNALSGNPSFYPIYPEDLKFKRGMKSLSQIRKRLLLR